VRSVRGVDEIHVVDARGVFLGDAREDALCPRALNAYPDAWEFPLEHLGISLGHGDLHGRVEVHFAFPARGPHEGRRDGLGRRGLGQDARRAGKGRHGPQAIERSAPRDASLGHP